MVTTVANSDIEAGTSIDNKDGEIDNAKGWGLCGDGECSISGQIKVSATCLA